MSLSEDALLKQELAKYESHSQNELLKESSFAELILESTEWIEAVVEGAKQLRDSIKEACDKTQIEANKSELTRHLATVELIFLSVSSEKSLLDDLATSILDDNANEVPYTQEQN